MIASPHPSPSRSSTATTTQSGSPTPPAQCAASCGNVTFPTSLWGVENVTAFDTLTTCGIGSGGGGGGVSNSSSVVPPCRPSVALSCGGCGLLANVTIASFGAAAPDAASCATFRAEDSAAVFSPLFCSQASAQVLLRQLANNLSTQCNGRSACDLTVPADWGWMQRMVAECQPYSASYAGTAGNGGGGGGSLAGLNATLVVTAVCDPVLIVPLAVGVAPFAAVGGAAPLSALVIFGAAACCLFPLLALLLLRKRLVQKKVPQPLSSNVVDGPPAASIVRNPLAMTLALRVPSALGSRGVVVGVGVPWGSPSSEKSYWDEASIVQPCKALIKEPGPFSNAVAKGPVTIVSVPAAAVATRGAAAPPSVGASPAVPATADASIERAKGGHLLSAVELFCYTECTAAVVTLDATPPVHSAASPIRCHSVHSNQLGCCAAALLNCSFPYAR